MLPYYLRFFKEKPDLKILIYSGDTDIATVPHPYTQLCLSELNQTLIHPWTPWKVEHQTAGYFEIYNSYTYATIKGAGHEAPMYQPFSTYALVSHFVLGKNLTRNESRFVQSLNK